LVFGVVLLGDFDVSTWAFAASIFAMAHDFVLCVAAH
jgi:hypothetical protein